MVAWLRASGSDKPRRGARFYEVAIPGRPETDTLNRHRPSSRATPLRTRFLAWQHPNLTAKRPSRCETKCGAGAALLAQQPRNQRPAMRLREEPHCRTRAQPRVETRPTRPQESERSRPPLRAEVHLQDVGHELLHHPRSARAPASSRAIRGPPPPHHTQGPFSARALSPVQMAQKRGCGGAQSDPPKKQDPKDCWCIHCSLPPVRPAWCHARLVRAGPGSGYVCAHAAAARPTPPRACRPLPMHWLPGAPPNGGAPAQPPQREPVAGTPQQSCPSSCAPRPLPQVLQLRARAGNKHGVCWCNPTVNVGSTTRDGRPVCHPVVAPRRDVRSVLPPHAACCQSKASACATAMCCRPMLPPRCCARCWSKLGADPQAWRGTILSPHSLPNRTLKSA